MTNPIEVRNPRIGKIDHTIEPPSDDRQPVSANEKGFGLLGWG